MYLIQRVRCLFGAHRRSRSKAWYDGGTPRSRCAGCGARMTKKMGRWAVDSVPPDNTG